MFLTDAVINQVRCLVFTFISLVADTEHLVGVEIFITPAGKLPAAAGSVRTHAGAAVVSRAQDRVTIVAVQTPAEMI